MTTTPTMPSEAEGRAADWSSSYAHILAKAAAHSARSLKLYQEALELVSQGKLAPSALLDHVPSFAQSHAAAYSNKVAELGARFLTDLLRLGLNIPGQAAPKDADITPPKFDPSNTTRWFEQLAEYSGRMNAQALKAYRAQLDRVAAGDSTPSEVQNSTSEYLSQQVPSYLQSLTQAYFALLEGLNDVRAEYEEGYFRGVLAGARGEDGESPIVLRLEAPVGTTAAASLEITNTTSTPSRIRYLVRDVRRIDGVGPAFQPEIAVTPESFELQPGASGSLTLSLVLSAERFDADAWYAGMLYIIGGTDLRVEVQLRITARSAK